MAEMRYCSIVDCPLCGILPLKMDLDLERESRDKVPAELEQLSTVLLLDLEEHAYASNTVKLLKCPSCGTYYYFNHYVDEGAHFMDPTSNDLMVRRYPPLTVMRFLEGIVNRTLGTFPQPLGKLRDAFLEGRYPYPNEVSEKERGEKLETVVRELDEIKGRYSTLMEEFIGIVKTRSPEWYLKKYMVESLVIHFVNEEEWGNISELLLKHRDPVVRVEALKFLVGYSTGDAPVIDIIHIPYDIREKLAKILKRKRQLNEIAQVASELALSDHGYTYRYDMGFGESRYYKWPIQYDGLYSIIVLAKYVDFSELIPQLISLLSEENEYLNYKVCWTLRSISERNKAGAKLILKLIKSKKVDSKVLQSKEVQELIEACRKQEKTSKKKKPKKKSVNKNKKRKRKSKS